MRPLRLSLEGFTCFKDPQQPLDFRDLDLLAISGPTGSGKSSLLDAMIFALFGRVPRMGKVGIAELISLGRDRMAVTLDFRLGESSYRVTRVAHRTRPTQALLEELRGDLSQPLAEGVRNVDERVQELLGLDYETFVRAVILPQGEFAAFLKSRPGEQQKILRDLLRLHVYETMRRLAGEEQRRLGTRIESDRRRIAEDFADATGETLAAKQAQTEQLERDLASTEKALGEQRTRVDARRRDLARIRSLEEPRDKARRRVEELTAKHEAQAKDLTTLIEGRQAREAQLTELRQGLAQARSAAAAIAYDPELDAGLDAVRDAAGLLADRRRTLHQQTEQLELLATRRLRSESDAAVRQSAVTEARARLRSAEDLRREREAALRQAEHQNHVVLLQRELVAGEDCPVCEQLVEAPPEAPELPELEALTGVVAAAREQEQAARGELETARGEAAAARAAVEALRGQSEDADRQAKQLAIEVGDEAGALQAEVGDKVRDDPGEHVEERVLAAVHRVAGQRSEHAALRQEQDRLERKLAEAEGLRERFDDEIASTEGRQQELQREITAAREEAEDYDRRILEVTAGEAIEGLEDELRALRTRESEERQRLGALAGALTDLERRVVRRQELEAGLEELAGSHRCYRQLTQDLRSDRFEAYLLEKTFRELVQGASVRLMKLSQRYALDFTGGSFRVLDHDNASQPRSADTLSGGETFLASLSLALELSEQIQSAAGAVSLDSIFIDEGFSTLDPETLELVIEAIESLPTGGRMVGIITHIPELTRRLPYRVWVEKSPTGSRYRVEEG